MLPEGEPVYLGIYGIHGGCPFSPLPLILYVGIVATVI
jgi:hypothetical protein